MAELNSTIKKSVVLKTYQSNIQLGRCTVKIRHNERSVKCRFFVCQELPSNTWDVIHKIAQHNKSYVETIGSKTTGRKFDSQTK